MKSKSNYEQWESDPAGMMGYYQSQSYTFGQSIADLVDNCYDAKASNIEITINYDEVSGEPYVLILDDGVGISEADIRKAMRLGLQKDRSSKDLGVYGIGMKLSSLAQANEVTIASKKNGKFCLRRISAKHIRKTNKNELLKTATDSEAFKTAKELIESENFSTMVLLEDLHGSRRFLTMDKEEDESLEDEITRIETHLGLTFHRVIEQNSDISLSLNEEPITALDPMMRWENSSAFGTVEITETVPVLIEGSEISVNVSYVILPHVKLRSDKKRCESIHKGYKKANDMQGLYLYRNDRLIQYGDWQGLYGSTNDEHNKYAKISVEIPPEHASWFGLNPTKTGIQLPEEFLRKLKAMVLEKRSWGNIKSGFKMPFLKASSHRYRNEGKLADKKKNKAKKAEKAKSNNEDNLSIVTIPAENTITPKTQPSMVKPPPGTKGTTKFKTQKPTPVVLEIKEEEDTVLVSLDKNKEGYEYLIGYIRKWAP